MIAKTLESDRSWYACDTALSRRAARSERGCKSSLHEANNRRHGRCEEEFISTPTVAIEVGETLLKPDWNLAMTRFARLAIVVLSWTAISFATASNACAELETFGLAQPPNLNAGTSWNSPSPLPTHLFDFEDPHERGEYPYRFALTGSCSVDKPGKPGMTTSGERSLVIRGGGKSVVTFLVPVEQLEFTWRDSGSDAKTTMKIFDAYGTLLSSAYTGFPGWSQYSYYSPSQPIARAEFELQSAAEYSVIDDMLVRHHETARAFCYGDGVSAACPCWNQSAIGAFEGCMNSTNRGARMHSIGSDQVDQSALRFFVSGLPVQRPMLLLEGTQDGVVLPFRDGLLCLGHLRRRLEVSNSDGSGTVTVGSSIFQGKLAPLAGETLDYQCWFRDPVMSPCGTGAGLSQAQRVFWN